MNDSDLGTLVSSWILAREVERDSSIFKDNWWAIKKVMSLADDDPDSLWQFILHAYNKNMSEKAQAVFAAGPLEDLISKHGSEFIERIEQLAKQDKLFSELLGGVWRGAMVSDEVWSRIENVWGGPWDD